MIGTDLLEDLRHNAGWSIARARALEAAMYQPILGYIPVYLQSDEAYATYVEGARANYGALAAAA